MSSKFKNLAGGKRKNYNPFLWIPFLIRRLFQAQYKIPQDHIATSMRLEEQNANSITWLGHDTFLIKVAGKTILTDPFFSDYAFPIQHFGPKRVIQPPIAISELPPIDIIIVSHNHYDHLDIPTIKALKNKSKIQVIVPIGLKQYFVRAGYKHIHELEWHQCWRSKDVTILAVPAYHFSGRKLSDFNKTLWAGYCLYFEEGMRLYFSGDTGYGDYFKKLGLLYGPFDFALVPIGAYEPNAIMCDVHTTPEEAVALGIDMHAKTLIGMHWGTIPMADEPLFEPKKRFLAAGKKQGYSQENLWAMQIGETRIL